MVITRARYQARTGANKGKIQSSKFCQPGVFAFVSVNQAVVMADVAHRPRDEINAQPAEAKVDQEQRHQPVHDFVNLIGF
jgi:hypothetical protein